MEGKEKSTKLFRERVQDQSARLSDVRKNRGIFPGLALLFLSKNIFMTKEVLKANKFVLRTVDHDFKSCTHVHAPRNIEGFFLAGRLCGRHSYLPVSPTQWLS